MSGAPKIIKVTSSRFGELEVPEDSIITFPTGVVGFPDSRRFVMFDYKAPFSWLHSVDDPNLAFVVMDGAEFTRVFDFPPPYGDKDTDLKENDEFAILVIVTIRPDPKMTTANVKAPLFVNLRTRSGVQVIYDDPKLSHRFPLVPQGDTPPQGGGEKK
jgi:flagellar assembly factor FliW